MGIIIVNRKINLSRFIKHSERKLSYVYFGNKDAEIIKLLNSYSCEELNICDYQENVREELFGAYIDLIGRLGKEINSIYWWAGFTSSKNRFISKFFPTLFAYYVICDELKKKPAENILVIFPPDGMARAIRSYCGQNSIEFTSGSCFCLNLRQRVREKIEHFARISYFIFNNWKRIFLAGKYFRNNAKGKEYYVVRTWVYQSSIDKNNKFSDPFFGRLPDYLTAQKKEVMVLAGIIGDYRSISGKLSNCREEYLIFPQEYFLRYSDVIGCLVNCYLNHNRIKGETDFCGLDVSEIVQEEINNDYRKYSREGLLQKYIIKNITNGLKIETFALTYENNPWEKICILALREYSKTTKIIGYQHAVVTKASANMFISGEEKGVVPIPDKIITAGEVTKNIMESYGRYPEGLIKSSCTLRHEYIHNVKKKAFSRKNTILVSLEGVPECYKLVDFVFNAFGNSKEYKIIIRTHPERPFSRVKEDLDFNMDLFDNFCVSTQKSIKDDLNLADILVYWGTTVSLEALMMGIPVIHVDLNDIITVDPLFDCKCLKWTVKRPEELMDIISKIHCLSEEEYAGQYNKAREYIEKYLQEVTDDRLKEFII